MKKVFGFTMVIILLAFVCTANSEEGKKKVLSPKSPLNSVDGILFPKGQFGFIFKEVYLNKDGVYDEDSELDPATNAPKEKEIFGRE